MRKLHPMTPADPVLFLYGRRRCSKTGRTLHTSLPDHSRSVLNSHTPASLFFEASPLSYIKLLAEGSWLDLDLFVSAIWLMQIGV